MHKYGELITRGDHYELHIRVCTSGTDIDMSPHANGKDSFLQLSGISRSRFVLGACSLFPHS